MSNRRREQISLLLQSLLCTAKIVVCVEEACAGAAASKRHAPHDDASRSRSIERELQLRWCVSIAISRDGEKYIRMLHLGHM